MFYNLSSKQLDRIFILFGELLSKENNNDSWLLKHIKYTKVEGSQDLVVVLIMTDSANLQMESIVNPDGSYTTAMIQ